MLSLLSLQSVNVNKVVGFPIGFWIISKNKLSDQQKLKSPYIIAFEMFLFLF